MRKFGALTGFFLLFVAAAALVPAPATAQQRGTLSPSDKRFSEGSELVQLDFKDVELAVVIETIARITGQNFIYDDRVRGRVTIVSPSEVSVDQAFAVFESVLKIKGFTAVPGPGNVLKIVPVRDAKESSIETIKDNRPSRTATPTLPDWCRCSTSMPRPSRTPSSPWSPRTLRWSRMRQRIRSS